MMRGLEVKARRPRKVVERHEKKIGVSSSETFLKGFCLNKNSEPPHHKAPLRLLHHPAAAVASASERCGAASVVV